MADLGNQEKIWAAVNAIPRGRVATYGQVASMAGLPGYARYVGYTLKQLPSGTSLPWHRVVNTRGRLSFPIHSDKYRNQKQRLQEEGIKFVKEKFSLTKYKWNQETDTC